MKTKVTIEITDAEDADEIFDAIGKELGKTFAKNLDALHDMLSEYGDGVTIVIRKCGKVPEGIKKVFEDLQEELAGFSAVFEDGDSEEPQKGKDESQKGEASPEKREPSFGRRLMKVILWTIVAVFAFAIWKSCNQ